MDQPVSSKPPRIILIGVLTIVALLFSATLVLFVYQNTQAAENITNSFQRIKKVRSFTAEVKILDNIAEMRIDHHSNPALFTRAQLKINELKFKKKDRLKIESTVNNKDLFLSLQYTHMRELVRTLQTAYIPNLQSLKAYQLVEPFLFNNRALHIDIQPLLEAQKDFIDEAVDVQANAELTRMLYNAMIIRPSRWRGSFSRIGPTHYKIGFKKDRLLAYIERLKTVDPELSQEQYAALKDIVTSSDNWDADLISIELDRRGNLEEIEIYAPAIPRVVVDRYVGSQTIQTAGVFDATLKNVAESLSRNRNKKKNEGRTKLVEIEMRNYNNAPKIRQPNRAIEAMDVLAAFESQELIATSSPTPTRRPPVRRDDDDDD